MIRFSLFTVLVVILCASSCKKPSCDDGKINQSETGTDCGGPCDPCPSCFDGVKNQNETDKDCGGKCQACPPAWNSLASGTSERLLSVSHLGDLVVAVGEAGTIVRSDDNGKTWNPVTSGVSLSLRSVAIASASLVFVVGDKGTLLKSVDGGKTFIKVSLKRSKDFLDVAAPDAQICLIAGRERTIYRSMDGGLNWKLTDSSNTIGSRDYFRISHIPGGNTYVIGDRYFVLSSNNGENWTSLSFNSVVDFTDFTGFYCLSDKRAFAINKNALFYSFDFVEWRDKLVRVASGQVDFIGQAGVFAGRDDQHTKGVIKLTQDNGVTWQDEKNMPVSTFLNDVCMLDPQEMVAVGDNGLILRRTRK